MRVCETFLSIQGEGLDSGFPTVFVRLTGCNLRCSFCDTAYAFSGGREMGEEELLEEISGFGCQRVCITGGEPPTQDIYPLCRRLREEGFRIKVETNGSLPFNSGFFDLIDMDIKTPSSGESKKMVFSNLKKLRESDELKFVISDRGDYDYALGVLDRFDPVCNVIFQPSFGALEPKKLGEWIIEDRLNVKLGIQLHKLLWGNERGF